MSSFSLWSFGPVLLFLEGNVAHFVVLLSVLAWVAVVWAGGLILVMVRSNTPVCYPHLS